MNKQIEALKMAVREMSVYAMQHSNDWLIEDVDLLKAIQACKEALAEAEKQEPVAWMYEDELPDNYPYEAMFQYSAIRDGVRMFPVFHPATWQSLSDNKIISLYAFYGSDTEEAMLDFARAIEQALKEKNHG